MNGKYMVKVSKLFGVVVLIWISVSLWRSYKNNYISKQQLMEQLKRKTSFISNKDRNKIHLNQQINSNNQDINSTQKQETFQYVCDKTGTFNGYEKTNRVEDLVIYSEMPKCGSGTLVDIFQQTARRATRKHLPTYHTGYTYPVPHEELYQWNKRLNYANGIFEETPPYLFLGHLRFLDFKEVGHKQPVFIDLVRDPINRTISAYHYGRKPQFNERANMTKAETKMSMDECFERLLNETGCVGARDLNKCLHGKKLTACKSSGIVERMTTWFSGYGSEVSVNKAKSNIDKYYLIIGKLNMYC
ncbi:unnamed protein product [Owenia fusiformis]|uniref:Sulfotransferase n=1 Tax=Owenia fusiformis TaxID=6347 RepID=A0A8S4PUB3_OWEFU|nr:unnamed protein product [Owenia fusiformis]